MSKQLDPRTRALCIAAGAPNDDDEMLRGMDIMRDAMGFGLDEISDAVAFDDAVETLQRLALMASFVGAFMREGGEDAEQWAKIRIDGLTPHAANMAKLTPALLLSMDILLDVVVRSFMTREPCSKEEFDRAWEAIEGLRATHKMACVAGAVKQVAQLDMSQLDEAELRSKLRLITDMFMGKSNTGEDTIDGMMDILGDDDA